MISETCPLEESASHHVENSSFGYDLSFGIWISRVRALLLEDPLISETCPLEECASHHEGPCPATGGPPDF